MVIYSFTDGNFRFFTAYYGSWARDKRIVFRVRTDSTPFVRAEQKGIRFYDRIYPSNLTEVELWVKSHCDYTILKTIEQG